MTTAVWVILLAICLLAGWFFGKRQSSGYQKPDETKLNQSFEEKKTKEKAESDAKISEIEEQNRNQLLDGLNRRM